MTLDEMVELDAEDSDGDWGGGVGILRRTLVFGRPNQDDDFDDDLEKSDDFSLGGIEFSDVLLPSLGSPLSEESSLANKALEVESAV